MKCTFCNKKNHMDLKCKFCIKGFCVRCIQPEVHQCEQILNVKTHAHKQLETTLVSQQIKEQKVIKI